MLNLSLRKQSATRKPAETCRHLILNHSDADFCRSTPKTKMQISARLTSLVKPA
jgi:hypothetical protein